MIFSTLQPSQSGSAKNIKAYDQASQNDDDARNREHARVQAKKAQMHKIYTMCIWVGAILLLIITIVRIWHLIASQQWHWLTSENISSIDKFGTGGLMAIMTKFVATAAKNL